MTIREMVEKRRVNLPILEQRRAAEHVERRRACEEKWIQLNEFVSNMIIIVEHLLGTPQLFEPCRCWCRLETTSLPFSSGVINAWFACQNMLSSSNYEHTPVQIRESEPARPFGEVVAELMRSKWTERGYTSPLNFQIKYEYVRVGSSGSFMTRIAFNNGLPVATPASIAETICRRIASERSAFVVPAASHESSVRQIMEQIKRGISQGYNIGLIKQPTCGILDYFTFVAPNAAWLLANTLEIKDRLRSQGILTPLYIGITGQFQQRAAAPGEHLAPVFNDLCWSLTGPLETEMDEEGEGAGAP